MGLLFAGCLVVGHPFVGRPFLSRYYDLCYTPPRVGLHSVAHRYVGEHWSVGRHPDDLLNDVHHPGDHPYFDPDSWKSTAITAVLDCVCTDNQRYEIY